MCLFFSSSSLLQGPCWPKFTMGGQIHARARRLGSSTTSSYQPSIPGHSPGIPCQPKPPLAPPPPPGPELNRRFKWFRGGLQVCTVTHASRHLSHDITVHHPLKCMLNHCKHKKGKQRPPDAKRMVWQAKIQAASLPFERGHLFTRRAWLISEASVGELHPDVGLLLPAFAHLRSARVFLATGARLKRCHRLMHMAQQYAESLTCRAHCHFTICSVIRYCSSIKSFSSVNHLRMSVKNKNTHVLRDNLLLQYNAHSRPVGLTVETLNLISWYKSVPKN